MQKKPNRAERIIAFLESRYPGWVPAIELEPVGGRCAWRTAVSEARAIVKAKGGDIENRLQQKVMHAPSCASWLAWDIPGACNCTMSVWTLSEYRLKQSQESDKSSLALAHGVDGSELGDPREVRTENAANDGHDLNEFSLR